MPERIEGGCLCGAIRFKADRPPDRVGYCHCRRCQRGVGSPFGTAALFDRAALRIVKGEVTWYATRGTTSLLPPAASLPSGLLSTDTNGPDTLQFSEAALDRVLGVGVGNGSVVMVEFVSEQPSIFSGFVLDGADYSLRRFAYARPRLVGAIACTDC